MGILNLTPDSFYAGSRTPDPGDAAARALAMAEAGADILDLGAESTRPGAEPLDPDVEAARLMPALAAVRAACPLPITVDTTRAATARRALDAGADGINDISAGTADPDLLPLAAGAGCGLVLMHMLGSPRTMQRDPHYEDVVVEVTAYLAARARAAEQAGVAASRICVDPGLGFGKLPEHNLALMAGLARIGGGRPVLLGASRKSFIGHVTGAGPEDRLAGSLAAAAAAFSAGCAVVRVHDVAQTVQLLEVLAAIRDQEGDREGR